MPSLSLRVVLATALALSCVDTLRAGAFLRAGSNPLRWNRDKVLLRVPRIVHMGGTSGEGVHPSETAGQVHAAIWEAARAWNRAERATVKIELELTDEQQIGGSSNLVTFTDPKPFDSGQCDVAAYLSCTLLSHGPDGTIVGVNIAFNPYKPHSSTGIVGTHDIGIVMMHELGHALGLDHSAMLDSIMNVRVEREPVAGAPADFAIRTLSPDDLRTLEALYPSARPALIEGTVRRNLAAVPGSHVLAVDTEGHPVSGVVTGADGRFSLAVPAGEYRLVAEPLDGPVLGREMQSVGAQDVSFPTVFWTVSGGESGDGDSVAVAEGEVRTGIDFAISTGSAKANLETIGIIQGGLYWGFFRVAVARGSAYTLGLTRSAPYGSANVAVPRSRAEMDGPATVPTGIPQLVRQKAKIPADMPCGSYVVQYSSDGNSSLLAGGLRVVANPVVDAFDASVVAGRAFSIRGKDLACRSVAAEPAYEGAPWPTQLDGVSVRIGDRFAPLVSVSPNEIVVEAPGAAAGSLAEVAVMTGTGMQSPAVSVRIESAPAQQ